MTEEDELGAPSKKGDAFRDGKKQGKVAMQWAATHADRGDL